MKLRSATQQAVKTLVVIPRFRAKMARAYHVVHMEACPLVVRQYQAVRLAVSMQYPQVARRDVARRDQAVYLAVSMQHPQVAWRDQAVYLAVPTEARRHVVRRDCAVHVEVCPHEVK